MAAFKGSIQLNAARSGTARRSFNGSHEVTALAHESVERAHPGAYATNGLVTQRRHGYQQRILSLRTWPKDRTTGT